MLFCFMQDEIFDIVLNNEGRSHILRLFGRVRFVFIASVIWSVIALLSTIAGIISTLRIMRNVDDWLTVRLIVMYAFMFLNVILVLLTGYYYYAFSKQIREGIDAQDPVSFNRSFGLLATNAVIVAISVVLNIAYLVFNIFYGFFSVGRAF